MSWIIVVEYTNGDHMVFDGEEAPEEVLGKALDICGLAMQMGIAKRMVMTYEDEAFS